MKKTYLITLLVFICVGCNMNPNKEARIQQLEAEFENTINKLDKLESRIQILESENKTR